MNIYEPQPELENNKTKTKKLMIILGVAIVILFVLSIPSGAGRFCYGRENLCLSFARRR